MCSPGTDGGQYVLKRGSERWECLVCQRWDVGSTPGFFPLSGDLQLLVNMLLNKGMAGGSRLIAEEVIGTFLTPDAFRNGLGWMMDPDNAFMKNGPAGSFGHTGFTGTSIAVVPEYHLSVIILINRQNVGLQAKGVYYNPSPIREAVFKAALDWCR
jgi:CubicO group peptidase (beta-lactamase class C family)